MKKIQITTIKQVIIIIQLYKKIRQFSVLSLLHLHSLFIRFKSGSESSSESVSVSVSVSVSESSFISTTTLLLQPGHLCSNFKAFSLQVEQRG